MSSTNTLKKTNDNNKANVFISGSKETGIQINN